MNRTETQRSCEGTIVKMKTTTPTYRRIAVLLTAVMLFTPFASAFSHACAGMSASGTSGHATPASTDPVAEVAPEPLATHHAHHSHGVDTPSSSSIAEIGPTPGHDCMGPCAGSDCCSMRAAPLSQGDGFIADRVQSVTNAFPMPPESFAFLFPQADRAPPRPPQPATPPSLLSARLHVWTATFLT